MVFAMGAVMEAKSWMAPRSDQEVSVALLRMGKVMKRMTGIARSAPTAAPLTPNNASTKERLPGAFTLGSLILWGVSSIGLLRLLQFLVVAARCVHPFISIISSAVCGCTRGRQRSAHQ